MPCDLTLEEMAARIGTKREIVCRQLYRLEDEGAIKLNRRTLRIVDREALKRFASLSKG